MCREKYESLRKEYVMDPNQRELPEKTVDALKTILTGSGLTAR
jgi:hypothetical protein